MMREEGGGAAAGLEFVVGLGRDECICGKHFVGGQRGLRPVSIECDPDHIVASRRMTPSTGAHRGVILGTSGRLE